MLRFIKKLRSNKGEAYIDVPVLLLVAMLVIAFAIKLYPAFIIKSELDTLAKQTLREAQLEGKINIDYSPIAETIGVEPEDVKWIANTIETDNVQFYNDMEVRFKKTVDIGFFEFASFPIPLEGRAKGKSEVYWK